MNNKTVKKIFMDYVPMAITAIGILVCAIVFEQMFIKVLPLFFSLIIMLLNAKANRIGFLLGALNSCIYIIGYFMEGVYGTMTSTLFGIAMALIAYFRWKKDAYGKATVFRSFSGKQRILLSGLLVLAWAICAFVLWKMDGTAVVTDGLALVLGVVVPILNIVAYIESPALNLVSIATQLFLWVQVVFIDGKMANLTYLIYMAYALYMTVRTFFRWLSLYKEQQALGKVKKEELSNAENIIAGE